MRALGSICDTTSTLYVTKRNSVFPDVLNPLKRVTMTANSQHLQVQPILSQRVKVRKCQPHMLLTCLVHEHILLPLLDQQDLQLHIHTQHLHLKCTAALTYNEHQSTMMMHATLPMPMRRQHLQGRRHLCNPHQMQWARLRTWKLTKRYIRLQYQVMMNLEPSTKPLIVQMQTYGMQQ